MGGSGTRVVARILMHAGRYMGVNRNVPKEDALEFAAFDYRWAPAYLTARAGGGVLRPALAGDMRREFDAALGRHLAGLGDSERPWGWKHSPSVHLLPFLNDIVPGLRFVHVIRDGRDAAFGESGGRTHVRRLGRAVLDGDPSPVTPDHPAWRGRPRTTAEGEETTPLRKAHFWRDVNMECSRYAASHLEGRYLLLRLEDLCDRPRGTVAELLAFADPVGLGPDPIGPALAEIQTPSSMGGWRNQDHVTAEGETPPVGGS